MRLSNKRLRVVSTFLTVSLLLTGAPVVPELPMPASVAAVFGAEEVSAATLTASDFQGLTPEQVIQKALPLAQAESARTGIKTSIILAQFILETGWGKSEVFRNANNGFGMSATVSHNTWAGSVWDGKSIYTKEKEPDVHVRIYKSFNDSMRDYTNYLLNAMKGSSKRYAGISTASSFKQAAEILSNGGYCPSAEYVGKLCSINDRYNLVQYDTAKQVTEVKEEPVTTGTSGTVYIITASSGLRIRKGPGTSYARIAAYAKGTRVTVTEIRNGWGKVNYKGQTGWICLTYARKA